MLEWKYPRFCIENTGVWIRELIDDHIDGISRQTWQERIKGNKVTCDNETFAETSASSSAPLSMKTWSKYTENSCFHVG